MHTWWRAVCDEHKAVCDCFVNNPIRTAQLLGDKCVKIAQFFQDHWDCKLRLVHKDKDLDFLFENNYTFVLRRTKKE